MVLTRFILLRTVLIALLAVLTGPRPVMATGDGVVICGANGAQRMVIYDFEAGAPVEPAKGFVTCDQCLAFAAFLPPDANLAAGPRVDAIRQAALPTPPAGAKPQPVAHPVRGPPLLSVI